jgi:ribose transport system substrate-binding protein
MRRAVALTAVALTAVACTSARPDGGAGPSGSHSGSSGAGSAVQAKFFSQAAMDREMAQRKLTPTGDPNSPWLQAITPQYVDTAKYTKKPPWHVCFSNAGVGNPWRITGLTTMRAEAKQHPEIKDFTVVDAESKDDKQISDLSDLQSKNCDAIIVSPNTTAALTPAVERLCKTGVPVIVFDRGVTTQCPVTYVHPIGGYAFGAASAEFIASHVPHGGKVLALRILPGVDQLETRWGAAKSVFAKAGVRVVGAEFTDGDPAKTKTIVGDYIQRFGNLDGVWMDAGATTVAAVEAFQDTGKKVPPIDGEDQQDWLQLWQRNHFTGFSSVYPVYQWRTAVIAAADILSGRKVPREWVLPQPTITDANLAQWITPNMPPLFYSSCGCQHLPGFPRGWGGQ